MLTIGKQMALQELIERVVCQKNIQRRSLDFIGCPFHDLDDVCELVRKAGFHIVDCELFRYRRVQTDEFCRLIEWDTHPGFALLLPRVIPFTLAMFLYQAADHGIISTSSEYSSNEKYRSLAGKAWLVIMTPEDWEHAELETGWDRSKLTRVLGEYCWLHDSRYDDNSEVIAIKRGYHRDQILINFPNELDKAIRFNENKNWESFFPRGYQNIHKVLLGGSFDRSRYFSVTGTNHNELFEDALNEIGNSICDTVSRMLSCQYSEYQIELTVRTTIILRVVKILLRYSEQKKALIKPNDPDNILGIIWDTLDLYRFEFQSLTEHRVIRAYIPWHNIRETAMRYAARKAANIINVEYEEMYDRGFKDAIFPPAQVWSILLCANLFDVCHIDVLRDWWAKYVIPEYLSRGECDRLIINPQQIDAWAPEEYS